MTDIITTNDALVAAIRGARGGETLLVGGGDWPRLDLSGLRPAGRVTIAPADPASPPAFLTASVRNCADLSFAGLLFDYRYRTTDKDWVKPFIFAGCSGLTFQGCVFDGDIATGRPEAYANGFAFGYGPDIADCAGTTIEGCELARWFNSLVMRRCTDTVIRGNRIHSGRMDALKLTGMTRVLIEGNDIRDFFTSLDSPDHCDMIQFFTNGTDAPSVGIIIRGNTLDIGRGLYTQSIFMRNEEVDTGRQSFEAMAYRDVLIEENVIVNAQAHGITVGETIGLTIRNNTILHADGGQPDGADASVEIPKINLKDASRDVLVERNVTHPVWSMAQPWARLNTAQPGWTVRDNLFWQDSDPAAPGHVSAYLVDGSWLPDADGAHRPQALLDGAVMAGGLGAARARVRPVRRLLGTIEVWREPDGTVTQGKLIPA